MPSVFISHSSKDDAIVREIRQSLESLGIEVWADSERLSGGDLLTPKIQQSIEKADHFLAVVSLNALNSAWVQREIKHAQAIKRDGYKVVPLMLPGIGAPILKLLFGEEPVGVQIGEGPAAVTDSLPHILAAIGVQLPTEIVKHVQAQAAPVADLILELVDPAIEQFDGARRATAIATLTYDPPDGGPKVESARYKFTAPPAPLKPKRFPGISSATSIGPAGSFKSEHSAPSTLCRSGAGFSITPSMWKSPAGRSRPGNPSMLPSGGSPSGSTRSSLQEQAKTNRRKRRKPPRSCLGCRGS
jgi:hypothetical protein